MSATFTMYPTLSQQMIMDSGCDSIRPSFSYTDSSGDHPLTLENENDTNGKFSAELRDPRCQDITELRIMLTKRVVIKNPAVWFGSQGVAAHDAVLGLAVRWTSTKSEHRGVLVLGELRATDSDKLLEIEYTYDRSFLKGCLSLETIVYIKKAGTPEADEKHLAGTVGTVVGTLDFSNIYIDGNGSLFPITTVSEPGKPLWWVRYDSIEPLEDQFDYDNVEIQLNRAHPCYEALKIESSLKESPLFLEVISSALFIIVNSTKDVLGPDWDNVLNGNGFSHGSIAEAVYYFIKKLGWDVSNQAALAESIHKFFDDNLKGGSL